MTSPCPFEVDVLAAASSSRWPTSASVEVRAHLEQCAECREMAEVVSRAAGMAMRDAEVALPSAGEVWWRLAVRARLEREEAAARPVIWLQGLAAACGAGLVLAVVGRGWSAAEPAWATTRTWFERLAPSLPSAVQPATEPLLALMLAASATLAVATLLAAAFVWLADD